MKKAWKTGIGLLLGVLFLVCVIAGIAVWIVFTPEKLTPIVRKEAARYLSGKTEIGRVELTFFSTFPHFGLQVTDVTLIRPFPGAPSDTVARIGEASLILDAQELLMRKSLIVKELRLRKIDLQAYADSSGNTNYSVWASDTLRTSDAGEPFRIPFRIVQLGEIAVEGLRLTYTDASLPLQVTVNDADSRMALYYRSDKMNVHWQGNLNGVSLRYAGEPYLRNDTLQWDLPLSGEPQLQTVNLEHASVSLNGLPLFFDGFGGKEPGSDRLFGDFSFSAERWPLKRLLQELPPTLAASFSGIEADGLLSAGGTLSGVYADSVRPWLSAGVQLYGGTLRVDGFPLPLHEVEGRIRMQTDLRTDTTTSLQIESLRAQTPRSAFELSGNAERLLSDPALRLTIQTALNLHELRSLLPDTLPVSMGGTASGSLTLQSTLSRLQAGDIAAVQGHGTLSLHGLTLGYDTLSVQLDRGTLRIDRPDTAGSAFLQARISGETAGIGQGTNTSVRLAGLEIQIGSSDPTQTSRTQTIVGTFYCREATVTGDSLSVYALRPSGMMRVDGRLWNGTSGIPTGKGALRADSLAVRFGKTQAAASSPGVAFALKPDESDPSRTSVFADYENESFRFETDESRFDAGAASLSAVLAYDSTGTNPLLRWSPVGSISLETGRIEIAGLTAPICIPAIRFRFDPQQYVIDESRVQIGRSDFGLTGTLTNVTPYLRGDSLLRGNFSFTSGLTDVNSLMDLTSGIGNEEQPSEPAPAGACNPFLVPKGMAVTLRTDIDRALVGNDTVRNVTGKVTVNDGVLALEEMRFATSAARMELTALYRTPRKNHIFAGIDYHMYDVEIANLLGMIPDLDSIMPMLRSFGGNGEFHMAVETYLDSCYHLKKSTLRGAASIKGQNLVLMDGETFHSIAKKLHFRRKTENRIDSLSAEFTIFKEEIDVYPFLMVLDKYRVVVGGRHNLDMSFDYNISLIESPLPFRLAVDVRGTPDKLRFRLARCKYPEFYRPVSRKAVNTSQLELRKLIRNALTSPRE